MPPDGLRDSAQDWMRYARSDLATAELRAAAGVLSAVFCFHAQQAAEKALKAVYVHAEVEYPFVHDLHALINGLPVDAPDEVWAAQSLTRYAVASRYPRPISDADPDEVDEAIELARAVVVWAAGIIEDA